MVLCRPTRLLELTPKKDVLFIIGDWNAKVRSQEIPKVRSQETPGVVGKFDFGVQNEARQRLIEFCQDNPLITANTSSTTQEDSTHGHHQMVNTEIIDYILCSQRWRSSVQSAKTRRGADCGLDHELLLSKSDLRKWGKPLEHSGMT